MTSYYADLRQCGITYQDHPVVACSSELAAILGASPLPKITEILNSSYEIPSSNPPRRLGIFVYLTEQGVARIRVECQLRRDGWGLLIAQDTAELPPAGDRCHGTVQRHGSSSTNDHQEDQQTAEKMTSSQKRKGDRAEVAARDFLRGAGFPGCERTRAGYARDSGDLHLAPGVIAQVKDARTLRWSEWLAELDAQRTEAGAEVGMLIVKRPGHREAARWLAVMPVEAMASLLRAAGYGTSPDHDA